MKDLTPRDVVREVDDRLRRLNKATVERGAAARRVSADDTPENYAALDAASLDVLTIQLQIREFVQILADHAPDRLAVDEPNETQAALREAVEAELHAGAESLPNA